MWTTASNVPARKGRARALDTTAVARLGDVLRLGAVHRLAEAFEGHVGEHDLAAGTHGQVQAGPAAAGAEVEKPHSRSEPECGAEVVGLSHGGVAVGAPVAADDGLLDLAYDAGAVLAVAAGEQLAGVAFLTGDHAVSVGWVGRDWGRAG